MELLTIIISSLLAAISPANLILDQILSDYLRSQVQEVEKLEVRVDNAPSYQLLQGKVQRVLIATRGLQPITDLRIEALEIETDPLDVDLDKLQGKNWQESLRQPLQGGIRIVLSEKDLNSALQSEKIRSKLQDLINSLGKTNNQVRRYQVSQAEIDLMGDNKFGIHLLLVQSASVTNSSSLDIKLQLGIKILAGRTIQFIDPEGTVNGRTLSRRLLKGFAEGLSRDFDLRSFEDKGITTRLLQLEIGTDLLDLAAFVRVANLKQN